MQALAYANRVRLARAALKRSVMAGKLTAEEVIRSCPSEAETMTLAELLRSQRRWGRTRARKFLLALSLNESRQIGRLTERQRMLVAAELQRRSAARA
jgi:hypothetical protein